MREAGTRVSLYRQSRRSRQRTYRSKKSRGVTMSHIQKFREAVGTNCEYSVISSGFVLTRSRFRVVVGYVWRRGMPLEDGIIQNITIIASTIQVRQKVRDPLCKRSHGSISGKANGHPAPSHLRPNGVSARKRWWQLWRKSR
jgi:hypothetical protein